MSDVDYLKLAELESVHRPAQPGQCSTMLFNMRTDEALQALDVKTLLKCIKHAEEQETIPRLPVHWWADIWYQFGDL
ncbi:MAG: hypothetical protein ABJN40_23065 [Sneathiella sp.]